MHMRHMDKRVLLFSSDARPLYKGDIFRALALPDDHTLQFRYPRKYVELEFRDKPNDLVGKEAVIFFLSGNDQATVSEERKLKPHPIRACTIQDAFPDQDTQQIMLILRLGEFVNCDIEDITDARKLPPHSFVTDASIKDLRVVAWLDRVDSIKQHFPGILFYRLGAILSGDGPISPSYSRERRISHFVLDEESEYSIECSYYDPDGGGAPLKIDVSADALQVLNLFEFGGGADLDTKRLPLTTRTLKARSAPAYLKFHRQGLIGGDPNYVEIHWQLGQKSWKPFLFGVLTMLGAFGLFLGQTGLKNSKGEAFDWAEIAIRFGGTIVVGFVAGCLFKLFNKV
jgi:hypothetical protein